MLDDFYSLLTLTEKSTSEIRFVQGIENWGTSDTKVMEDLMNLENKFTRLLDQTMGEIYPNQNSSIVRNTSIDDSIGSF